MRQQKRFKDCNKDLLDDVVFSTKESPQLVKQVINFYSSYIASVIAEGAFETIMVPHFGKFKPKVKEIQWRMHSKGIERGGPINKDNDGTI